MIYGGPVVHGGRLYVATCNLAGAVRQQADGGGLHRGQVTSGS